MAGLFQGDAIIKTMVQLGLDDIRKNPWLIRHIFSDLEVIKYVADKYGKSQIDSATEWILNNNIDIYMRDIRDKDRLPCITIGVDNSNEKSDMKFMADQSSESIVLLPQEIGKPIPYILNPFIPTGYIQSTGAISVPVDLPLQFVVAGMILVNPDNGQGFPIQSIEPNTIFIEPNLIFEASQLGVLPHYRFYKARVEHTFFQESYAIGCHVHGEPQAAIWLHSVVLYSLLRYRESLLEANGFAESILSSSPLMPNANYTGPGGEEAWMRKITLSGQVENSWIKSPRRIIESVTFTQNLDKEYDGGIQILSNLNAPPFIGKESNTWYVTQDKNANPSDDDDE